MGNLVGKAQILARKYGPTAMVAAGSLGVVGSTIYACKQTMKLSDILDEAKECDEKLRNVLSTGQLPDGRPYHEEDYKHDKQVLDRKVLSSTVKTYAGPAACMAISLASILFGYRFVKLENAALGSAVAGFSGVLAKLKASDPEKYREIMMGKETTEVVQNPDTGEIEEIRKNLKLEDGVGKFFGKAIFDETNPKYSKSHYENLMFLRVAEHDLTNRMNVYGHLFLNEVLRYLSLETVPEGQYLGWVADGRSKISFNIDPYIAEMKGDLEIGANRLARPIILDLSSCTNIMYVYTKAFGADAANKLLKEEA